MHIITGILLERMTGIEPARSAWEAEVLPLNYIRILDNIVARSRCFVKENFVFYVSRLEGDKGMELTNVTGRL